MTLPEGYVDLAPGKLANVVTCLEMLDRPQDVCSSSAGDWSAIRVERPDSDWYRSLFRRVGEPYLWFSRLALSRGQLERVIRDPRVEIYAVEKAESEIGLLELDFRMDRECEIAFLGLIEAALGSGIGRALVNRAIALAWSHPIDRIWLHTCNLDHPKALPLYVRSSFRPYRRQIEICDDPRIRGLLPRTAAPGVPLL